jgi:hypothetical protein
MMTIRILGPDEANRGDSTVYGQTYKIWKETWDEEYLRLGNKGRLPSDNFTRQDEVLSIFVDGKPAALTFFHTVDLSTAHGRDDSYFEPWPKGVIDNLTQWGPKVLVCSAFTIAKEFRKKLIFNIPLADILAAASVMHLKNSHHDLMVGNMRNTRRANEIVYRYGAQLLRTIDCNGEPSDLVFFKKSEIPKFSAELEALINRSWIKTDIEPTRKVA